MRFLSSRALLLLALSLLLCPVTPRAQGGNAGFVQLTLNRDFTIPFFETFFDEEENPYLHFDGLMRALELPVEFDASLGSASGFLADGTTRFVLSLERRTVDVGKILHRLSENAVRLEEQGLFILWSEVGKWLPIKVEWSVEAYEVRIATGYRLPSVEKKLRDLERQRLLRSAEDSERDALHPREVPFFEPGMMEVNAGASTDSEGISKYSAGLTGVHIFLGGDLDYSISRQQASGQAGGQEQGFLLNYFRLKYYDDLRQNELTLGDTFTTSSPLLMGSATFRGASFFTGGRLLRFGRTAIIGNAPSGSEVDLYRLGVLIGFTQADQSGFYRFEDVPLTQSATLFEIRIFTPQGRRLTEFKLVSSQEEMMAARQFASQGGTGSSILDENPFRITAGEVRYGVFKALTVGGYLLQLEDFETKSLDVIETMDALGLFVLGRPAGWLNLLAEQARDSALPGTASRWGAYFLFKAGALEFERHAYDGEFAPPARRRSSVFGVPALLLTLDQVVGRTRVFLFNTNVTLRNMDFGEGRGASEQNIRLDRSITADIFLNITLFEDSFAQDGTEVGGNQNAEVTATYRFDTLSRAEAFYGQSTPVSGEGTTTIRGGYQKIQQKDSPWAYQASLTVPSGGDNLVHVSAGYLFANNFRVRAQADNEGAWQVGVDYSIPFRISGDGAETFEPGTFGRSGVAGAVFMDENGDGIRQEEESTLSEVHILAPGIQELETNLDGEYRGWGLPSGNPIAVEIDLLTTDALFAPLKEKYTIVPHPGELVRLDIPLAAAGGLSGIADAGGGRSISPANGVEMVLETPTGTATGRVPVEWDGTFILEGIPPGDYVLFGDPEDLAARGLQLVPERMKLKFPAGQEPTWFEDIEFKIEKRGGGALSGKARAPAATGRAPRRDPSPPPPGKPEAPADTEVAPQSDLRDKARPPQEPEHEMPSDDLRRREFRRN